MGLCIDLRGTNARDPDSSAASEVGRSLPGLCLDFETCPFKATGSSPIRSSQKPLFPSNREYVDALLAFGNLTEAMRYVRHQQVEDVIPPASFLERAVTLGNKQMLAAVYRFCVDSIPGFANSPDQRLYLPVLQQQVAAGGEGAPL